MEDEKKIKVDAYFSQEAYDAFRRGDAVDNNGFRSQDGTFYPDQPRFDFESEDEDDDEDDYQENEETEYEAGILGALAGAALTAGIYGAVRYGPKAWKWVKGKFSRKEEAVEQLNEKQNGQETSDILETNEEAPEIKQMTLKYRSSDFEEHLKDSIQMFENNPSDEESANHLRNALICMQIADKEIKQYTNEYLENHPEFRENIDGWKELINRYSAMNVKNYLEYLIAQKEDVNTNEIEPDQLQEMLSSQNDDEELKQVRKKES